jgi:hypothetical protein
MKVFATIIFALSLFRIPVFTTSSANACTNSYDTARDGSKCGQRASDCRSGGKGGYC